MSDEFKAQIRNETGETIRLAPGEGGGVFMLSDPRPAPERTQVTIERAEETIVTGGPLFDDEDLATFEEAIDTWGIDAQVDMAVEELAELIVTLRHVDREKADFHHARDELADVRIMFEQLAWFLGREETHDRVRVKMDRLRERLQEAADDE